MFAFGNVNIIMVSCELKTKFVSVSYLSLFLDVEFIFIFLKCNVTLNLYGKVVWCFLNKAFFFLKSLVFNMVSE